MTHEDHLKLQAAERRVAAALEELRRAEGELDRLRAEQLDHVGRTRGATD